MPSLADARRSVRVEVRTLGRVRDWVRELVCLAVGLGLGVLATLWFVSVASLVQAIPPDGPACTMPGTSRAFAFAGGAGTHRPIGGRR